MQTLIVAATVFEVERLLQHIGASVLPADRGIVARGRLGQAQVHLLITGIGMVNTAWWLGRVLAAETYDLLLNVGVCGTFDRIKHPVCSVVQITQDSYSELGAEDADGTFLALQDLGFTNFTASDVTYYNTLKNPKPLELDVPRVSGITVNTVHGTGASIARAIAKWQPEVESMEGASFMQAALQVGTPFAALRGVSNAVEPRNRAGWQLHQAAQAAQQVVIDYLQML